MSSVKLAFSSLSREVSCSQLSYRIINSSPYCQARVVTHCCEFVGPCHTFFLGGFAVPLEHQVGGAPNVDLGYHRRKARRDLLADVYARRGARSRDAREEDS